ncbi:ATP-binding protein [Brenneria corticis]|uniref:Sensor histidine kinase EnvZ n=1 Tax=Brenneria corticis TaxID=2173106 RepID=A0A2U1U5L3_9GAMM|nr:ATP-binding protein [Brenneria sp. CFCC 11842]PWC16922.1 two-component sensor histidine kinase [Brenneria sp. CFCC 11842]
MGNQLALLLVLALAISNAIAIACIQFTGALLHPVSRTLALERLTIAYQAAESLSATDAGRLLTSMNAGDTRFWTAASPDVSPFDMRPEERRLAAELAARPPIAQGISIVMQLERTDGGLARGHFFSAARWEPLRLRTTIRLPDGRYLNGIQHPIQAYEWSRLLSYSLPVASVPLLLIVALFMRRVVHPVKKLADATDRVSRGEWIAPLPLSGPQEARELTQAFNVMQERIARHVEGRTRVLAAISHDLNTPITELRLQVELLVEGPERDDMLESLAELGAMVSETLNFVRGDAQQEPTSRLSITDILDDLAKRYRILGHQVTWPGAAPMAIRGRPLALKRALGNLIDNAIVHGGDATLSLWREGDNARIEILDRGPGIDAASLEQVFEPFVQLGRHRGRGDGEIGAGIGLGLSIARACIHAHGGELILENRPPAGLCAVVWLPAD